ncbi:putative MPP superfamily phosphohydrolase [Peribacillus cavernae]|nr:putative MPP superfamily phosphohydrolase [Peribacillus cavernae]
MLPSFYAVELLWFLKMEWNEIRMNMIKGMHVHNGKPFYINEGLGQTGVNIRIGSRPEITLHHLSVSSANQESLPAM